MSYSRWIATVLAMLGATGLCLAIGMVLASSIVSAPGYSSEEMDPYLRVQDRVFGMRNEGCLVLVYGDSTALTGVDPRVVGATTGLKTCNISMSVNVMLALGTLPVDEYLAHNERPDFLVLQVGPETLYDTRGWSNIVADYPATLLLRHRRGWKTGLTLMRHPVQMVGFFWPVVRHRFIPDHKRLAAFDDAYRSPFEEFESSGGLLTLPSAAETKCRSSVAALQGPLDGDWIREMRQRYEAKGIRVLVVVSPVPECDERLEFFELELAPYVDSNVRGLPVGMFNDSDRHMTLEGARVESLALGRLIRERAGPERTLPPEGAGASGR